MTYNVFSGMLNPTHSPYVEMLQYLVLVDYYDSIDQLPFT